MPRTALKLKFFYHNDVSSFNSPARSVYKTIISPMCKNWYNNTTFVYDNSKVSQNKSCCLRLEFENALTMYNTYIHGI